MKRLCVILGLIAACRGRETPSEVSPVKAITVTLSAQQIVVGATAQANAVLVDAYGKPIVDRKPTWMSLNEAVVSVTPEGVVTGLQAGAATIRAKAGSAEGDAAIVVSNSTASSITLSRDTATLLIPNGAVQLIPTVKDQAGNIIANPTVLWESSAPLIAAVNAQGLVTGVATGTATIRASVDGQSSQTVITVRPTRVASAPLITSFNPPTIRPGGTSTIVGSNFAATVAGNVVVVDGMPATVNAATPNVLSITLPASGFPCAPTHPVFVQITANGIIGGGSAPLQAANGRMLAPGQSVVISKPSEVRCNEFSETGGRYVVSVYNAFRGPVQPGATGAATVVIRGGAGTASRAALASAAFPSTAAAESRAGPASHAGVGSADVASSSARLPWSGLLPPLGSPAFAVADRQQFAREVQQAHDRILERNLEYLRANAAAMRARYAVPRPPLISVAAARMTTVGAVSLLKVPNLDADNFCVSNIPVGVRTVFVGAHSIVVEDTSASFKGKPTLRGFMDGTLTRLGQEFESVMWPILTSNFGNPLVLDAQLSGTGKVIMLFSPRVNAMRQGRVLGFSVTCDFQQVAKAPSSNVGELFYAAVPTSQAAGYADPESRDSWLRIIRATVIHEVKHVVQFGERLSRGLPFEERSWEEGMARNVEELYARTFYGVDSGQNTGYAASVGCDLRFAMSAPPQCNGRPLLMLRHFDALYQYLSAPAPFSPLGRVIDGDFSFYASAWSLERWANDHFAASGSQFLKDFTVSPATGIQNLEARTGRPWEEMLGEWSLGLYLDDEPGFVPENARLRFPSWNLRDIWLGLCADLGPCLNPASFPQLYPRPNPSQPTMLPFGTFAVSSAAIAGGSFSIFELTGLQTGTQLLEIRSTTDGDPPPTIRVAVVRVR